MSTELEDLERRPNWEATYICNRNGKTLCLMRTMNGGHYWHQPDYQGLVPAGATMAFCGIDRNILELQRAAH